MINSLNLKMARHLGLFGIPCTCWKCKEKREHAKINGILQFVALVAFVIWGLALIILLKMYLPQPKQVNVPKKTIITQMKATPVTDWMQQDAFDLIKLKKGEK